MAAVWPRRLALVVPPASGESFASWVDRMALRNGCPPWAMIEALGLNVRASSDVRSLAYGVVTIPETRRAIEAATGVSSEVVRGMHLEVFDGSVLDLAGVRMGDKESVRRAEGREWVQFVGSRVCPKCLAASGGAWLAWWKLGWATVCPEHRTLLVDLCPGCRVSVRRGPAGRPACLSRSRMPAPLRCGALLSGTVCDQPIPQISTSAVSHNLAAQQQLVLEAATHRRPALVAGQVVSAGQWFAVLFMAQRRYDPWAGTLWHEFCDDYHLTASPAGFSTTSGSDTSTQRCSNRSPFGNPARLITCTRPKPPKTWTCPRPLCCWPVKDYAPGRGLHRLRPGPPGEAQGRQSITPIGSF
ncbi:TniQ family protein [Nonomuraea fuscirosea]|uniref:TniQ family protein n=1 Tax=Nonomuraea fuscirosea TaxID=1291556 RepID=UPI00343FEBB3